MEMIFQFFPFSANVKEKDATSLIVSCIIYVVAMLAMGVINWILGFIPLIGFVAGLIGWVVQLYCVAGLVLAVLKFFDVLK